MRFASKSLVTPTHSRKHINEANLLESNFKHLKMKILLTLHRNISQEATTIYTSDWLRDTNPRRLTHKKMKEWLRVHKIHTTTILDCYLALFAECKRHKTKEQMNTPSSTLPPNSM